MADTGRHTSARDGRAEVARRHGETPAARARQAVEAAVAVDPFQEPPRGFEDAPLGSNKSRTQQRPRQARRWGIS